MRHSPVHYVALAMAVLLLPARPCAASVFNYLSTPQDVTTGVLNSWETVDVSTWVPAGATGVMLQVENYSGADCKYGVRKNGSTDTWMIAEKMGRKQAHQFLMIGVDANRVFEIFAEKANLDTYLVGYTMPGVTFFTNAVDKSLGSTGSWQDIDISSDTGTDTAIGAIFILRSATNKKLALRKKGSTDEHYTKVDKIGSGAWVGVDNDEFCQMKIENGDLDAFLVGYVTDGAVFFTNAVDQSTATKDTYMDVDITTDIGTDVANGALVEIDCTDGGQRLTTVRPNGSSFDHWQKMMHSWACSAVDGNYVFEQKINDTDQDLYLVAYTLLEINYRSIGTETGTLYSTGNATINAGSPTVTFGGSADLPTNIGQGDELVIGGDTHYILSRDSATQVTVQARATTTRTNTAYTIERVYNTLQAWETAREGDLVTDNRREVGVCYNDGTFDAGVNINGSTTSRVCYMMLTVAEGQRHTGVAGSGVVIDADGGPGSPLIWIQDLYTRIEWLELTNFDDQGILVTNTGTGSVFQNLLIHDALASEPMIETGYDAVFRNCILYGGWKGIYNTGVSDVTIENVTVYDMSSTGIDMVATADITVKNTIALGCGSADFDLPGTINYFGNNMFSTTASFDPDAEDGGNQAPPTDLEDLFMSIASGSEDLHLEVMDNLALDNGLDLSADFSEDVDGETRTAPWDIGADWEATDVNYRSVGTDSGTLYSTGTASINAGERIVTFSGATLPANIGLGDELRLSGPEYLYIYSRDSATQVTVQGVAAATHTNATYTIERAYNLFLSWETLQDGDLVGDDRIEVGVCYNDGAFDRGFIVDHSTTDSDHYLKLTVAPGHRHDGTPGSGARLDAGGGLGYDLIKINNDYTVIEWLEITNFQDNKAAIKTANGIEATLQYLLIHDFDSLAAAIEIYHGGAIRNCIFFDGDSGIFFNMAKDGQTGVVENCTIYGLSWEGVKAWAGAYPVNIRNVISVGNGNDDFDLQNDTIAYFGYNLFDPANITGFTLPQDGGHQTPPGDLDDLFLSITPGSEDLHLEDEGHFAMDTGLDLSGDFVMDIDGETRLTPWDIGADWNPISTNYRSIGTNSGILYSIGDATIALNSTIVTFGFGADLPTNIGQGDELVIDAETFYIRSRDSATQVTTQLPAATPHSGSSYTIKRVYNALQAWEDDVDGDLAVDNRREIGVCYNDGWFTDRLVISGSTTDYGHYLRLTVAEGQRHNGLPNTGAGIDGLAFEGLDAITVEDEYTRIEWLEIKSQKFAGDAIYFDNSPAADNGLVHGVFVHSHRQNSNAGVRTAAPNTTIRNSFFTGGTSSAISVDTGCTMCSIENCSIIGNPASGHGVQAGAGTWVSIKNTISVNHPTGSDFELWGGITYFGNNMFGSVTGFDPDAQDGGNQLPPSTLERLFVDLSDSDAPDLHLETWGHHAGNTGLDLSSSFTDDIDGVTRVDNWDIGADEGVSGTDPLPPVVISWKEVEPQ